MGGERSHEAYIRFPYRGRDPISRERNMVVDSVQMVGHGGALAKQNQ